jgi:hypothetical protein
MTRQQWDVTIILIIQWAAPHSWWTSNPLEEKDVVSNSKLQGMISSTEEHKKRHRKDLSKKALSRAQLHLHHGFQANHYANTYVFLSFYCISRSKREDSIIMWASNDYPSWCAHFKSWPGFYPSPNLTVNIRKRGRCKGQSRGRGLRKGM